MATAVKNTIKRQKISTLDVLWAFYQSQPRQVKIAFRNMLETQDKADENKTVQWRTDLKGIVSLKDGWDGEGSLRINKTAIAHVRKFAAALNNSVSNLIRLYPTNLGAVMLKLETEKGRIKCEIGDTQMSYFLKRPGFETEYHSFEDINEETLSVLKHNLDNLL